jgi:hypothetical protein
MIFTRIVGMLLQEICALQVFWNATTSIERYHWRTGGQNLPDIVMSLLIDEQEV